MLSVVIAATKQPTGYSFSDLRKSFAQFPHPINQCTVLAGRENNNNNNKKPNVCFNFLCCQGKEKTKFTTNFVKLRACWFPVSSVLMTSCALNFATVMWFPWAVAIAIFIPYDYFFWCNKPTLINSCCRSDKDVSYETVSDEENLPFSK